MTIIIICVDVITSNNYDDNFHTVPDQETTRARNLRNSHIGHCTRTLKGTNRRTPNIQHK